MSAYKEGRQPCADFKPQRESNGYAQWDNVHECFGPFDDRGKTRCGGKVSFCENCYSDHHINGWDTCPQPQTNDSNKCGYESMPNVQLDKCKATNRNAGYVQCVKHSGHLGKHEDCCGCWW